MLVTLNLTERQARRVLGEAVRSRAKLEIDPRPEFFDEPFWGNIESREGEVFLVTLTDGPKEMPFEQLIGAMCDVRTILSGQLYMFSATIMDATTDSAPRRLNLSVPDNVQVANRRRFARKSPTEPVPVRISVPGAPESFVGNLGNISRSGLGCRVNKQQLDELLLIGEDVQVEFVLPWVNQIFDLPAEVCSKNACHDPEHLLVGLEFKDGPAATRATLELLRVALDNETKRLVDADGDQA